MLWKPSRKSWPEKQSARSLSRKPELRFEPKERSKTSNSAYTLCRSLEDTKDILNHVIRSMDDTRIITQNAVYWHIEFTTRWLRFIDDVEFYFVESEALIHLRSASRLGYWDFGVNRKRMKAIRSQFEKLAKDS